MFYDISISNIVETDKLGWNFKVDVCFPNKFKKLNLFLVKK